MKNSSFMKSSPLKSKTLTSPRNSKTYSKVISPTQRARSPKARSPIRAASPNPARISAFTRITSMTQLRQLALPGFLRVSNEELLKFSSNDLVKIGNSDSTFNESSSRLKTSLFESSKLQLSSFTEISQLVFDRNLPSDEVLINVGKRSLTREDLLTMQKGEDVNEAVVDVILKLIKRKNKKMVKKGRLNKIIHCFSAKFCRTLFQESSSLPVQLKKSFLDYEFVVFPCKFGYWTPVILDTKSKVIKYYDPIGLSDNKALVHSQIVQLITRELKSRQNTDISKTRWVRLQLEKINESEVFPDYDCGIYLFRQVHKFAVQSTRAIHPEALPEHRKKLIEYMFKHSN